MAYAQKPFGKREQNVYHGSISLNARRRVHCAIVKRVNRVIYFDVAEPVQLPFFFRIEFDYDDAWIDCEFVSQRASRIAAQMVVASFDTAPPQSMPTEKSKPSANLDELFTWCGKR